MSVPQLSAAALRVLSSLSEKQRTVPDTYPMTLNALQSACNQKTSREPVLTLSEAEILAALDELRDLGWITEQSGGRASRFAQQFDKALQLPSQSVAILTVLMLRGPQTAGELRLNCERMHRFADISAVEAFLEELSERAAGALVRLLPRQPGARESRWVHLLGEVAEDAPAVAPSPDLLASLLQRVEVLEQAVAALQAAR